MWLGDSPFTVTDWTTVAPATVVGGGGTATVRAVQFGTVVVKLIDCGPGFASDRWCEQGHVLLCLAGEITTELDDGRRFVLRAGMSFQVGDHVGAHRSATASGATLFVVERAA
jgi:quercetin dioxygenase-like cupin family protein